MCGPWIPLGLGIPHTSLLDSMADLIRRKIVGADMIKNTVFPPPWIF